MRLALFILFIAMPFIEIALLIQLGSLLGFWPTIAIVVATAIFGSYVLQAQGLAALQRVSQSVASGEPPVKPMVDGFFLAISGAFLLTPGVVTDAMGLLLLVPPVRHSIARWVFGRMLRSGSFTVHTYSTGEPRGYQEGPQPGPRQPPHHPSSTRQPRPDGPVIDGEFEEVKDK